MQIAKLANIKLFVIEYWNHKRNQASENSCSDVAFTCAEKKTMNDEESKVVYLIARRDPRLIQLRNVLRELVAKSRPSRIIVYLIKPREQRKERRKHDLLIRKEIEVS